jgi:hypothetical protein
MNVAILRSRLRTLLTASIKNGSLLLKKDKTLNISDLKHEQNNKFRLSTS